MGGLNAALSIATGALAAQEASIETVDNNIANANTPGYSREIVNLSSAGSTTVGGVSIGNGVNVDSVTSVRDQLLDLRIQQQTSSQRAASAQSGALASVEPHFSGSSGTIGSALSNFFTSLSALSSAPSNAATRQTAISNAEDLVNEFHATSAGLTATQSGLNTQVAGDVAKINSLAQQIASLNQQIAGGGQPNGGGALEDSRAGLEQQLAALVGTSITKTSEGDTITVGNGTALVVASRSFALSTSQGSNGLLQIKDSLGSTVTGTLTGGDLGGLLQVRDTAIPSFLSQLDSLAYQFGTAFNAAQINGYDQSGSQGASLFTLPSTASGAAASITLSSQDGSALAVSGDGSAGSNANLQALTAVQDQVPPSGLSPTGAFAALVNSVGNAALNASTQSSALQSSLTQLQNQQSAVSGVSIDEESSNLIRFQQAYEAAAEVVTTVHSLFTTTLNMVSNGG